MAVLIALAAVPILVLVVWAARSRLTRVRRARLRKKRAPSSLVDVLNRNVSIYSLLPDALRDELHGHINVFLKEKDFIGCDGLEISDEIRFTIAALACVLLLNRQTDYFPGFSSILIYPESYDATNVSFDGHLEIRRTTRRAGESWYRGPVVLSWKDVLHGASDAGDGYNVVLHEFAHKLDEENDGANGLPILRDRAHYESWAEVLGREYESLESRVARGRNRVLDAYGLTSPSEFFAVATESFFEKPAAMRDRIPDLYEQLRTYYCVDPASWKRAAPI